MTKKKEKDKSIETLEEELERNQFEVLKRAEAIKKANRKLYELEVKKNKTERKEKDFRKFLKGGVVEEFTGDFIDIGLLTGFMKQFTFLTEEQKITLKNIGDTHIAEKAKLKKKVGD